MLCACLCYCVHMVLAMIRKTWSIIGTSIDALSMCVNMDLYFAFADLFC